MKNKTFNTIFGKLSLTVWRETDFIVIELAILTSANSDFKILFNTCFKLTEL